MASYKIVSLDQQLRWAKSIAGEDQRPAWKKFLTFQVKD